MITMSPHVVLLLLLIGVWSSSSPSYAGTTAGLGPDSSPRFNRSSLPADFVLGAASSSYQYEGAAFEGGKGPSIWDTFTHNSPDKIADRSNGDVALDFYHRYKEDVKLMKYIGLNAFRMSISWPRIIPHGKLSKGVNKEGIAFYNNVINELIANGITPYVTLFHWDLPQALEDEYRGFLSPLIINDYRDFVELCFKEFGDRVKQWITFNEPFIFIITGYDGGFAGSLAPGRCTTCDQGNSATEPYVVAHLMLISHAVAVKLYKEKYQATQKGEIGITLVTHWFVPANPKNKLDVEAAQRELDFIYGWFLHPLVYGEYPKSMQSYVGSRLPQFTAKQRAMLKGSFDFLGLNYYTGNYASHILARNGPVSSSSDSMVRLTTSINGVPIGAPTGVGTFFVYPKGLHDLLVYTKEKYKNPTIYITETGMGDTTNDTVQHAVNDVQRVKYYQSHLLATSQAMKEGVKVKGLFAWTFLDCFEWGSGFTIRFGICYVDYKNGLKRIPKQSALWFKKFLAMK